MCQNNNGDSRFFITVCPEGHVHLHFGHVVVNLLAEDFERFVRSGEKVVEHLAHKRREPVIPPCPPMASQPMADVVPLDHYRS